MDSVALDRAVRQIPFPFDVEITRTPDHHLVTLRHDGAEATLFCICTESVENELYFFKLSNSLVERALLKFRFDMATGIAFTDARYNFRTCPLEELLGAVRPLHIKAVGALRTFPFPECTAEVVQTGEQVSIVLTRSGVQRALNARIKLAEHEASMIEVELADARTGRCIHKLYFDLTFHSPRSPRYFHDVDRCLDILFETALSYFAVEGAPRLTLPLSKETAVYQWVKEWRTVAEAAHAHQNTLETFRALTQARLALELLRTQVPYATSAYHTYASILALPKSTETAYMQERAAAGPST